MLRAKVVLAGFASLLLLGACQGIAPVAPTPVPPTPVPATPVPPTPPPPTPVGAAPAPATRVPTVVPTLPPVPATRVPTVVPTLPPVPATPVLPTRVPTVVPTEVPTPTEEVATDPTREAQEQSCDTAVAPGRVALPPLAPVIKIDPPQGATSPTPSTTTGGPRLTGSDPPPRVTAPHVTVLDDASGELMYSVDPFAREAPASITKIVTTIVALEREPDIKKVFTTTVSASALVQCDDSSVMGLEPDDHVTLETLLYGMMLPSGNDAAEQVAYSLAGSRQTYVAWMNAEVASLHLRDTHFVTPSGMDADDHYSSAYDMALLARYAMRNEEFRTLAATKSFVSDDYYMHNLNPLLYSYAGADGVKIGYTDIAGRTIVASATRDGHRVYVSLMGTKNFTGDCTALLDWAFSNFTW